MSKITQYSVKEVADMLGVDPRWLYRLALEDKVPHQHVGLDVRFTDDHIALLRSSMEQLRPSDTKSST